MRTPSRRPVAGVRLVGDCRSPRAGTSGSASVTRQCELSATLILALSDCGAASAQRNRRRGRGEDLAPKKYGLPHRCPLDTVLELRVRAGAFDSKALAKSEVREAEKQERAHYKASYSCGTRVVHHLPTPDAPHINPLGINRFPL